MKYLLTALLFVLVLSSCGNWLELGSQKIRIKDGTKAELINDYLYKFTAEQGTQAALFDTIINLDSSMQTSAHPNGQLLFGMLAEDTIFRNDYASIIIPANSTFTFSYNYQNYVFKFPAGTQSTIELGKNAVVDVYFQAIIYKNKGITALTANTSEFSIKDKDVIFYKNDSVVIDAKSGMFVHRKGIEEQNDALKEILPLTPVKTYDKLLAYFYDGSRFNAQSFGGKQLYISLDPHDIPIELHTVNNKVMIEKALTETFQPEYYHSSYQQYIKIPLITHSIDKSNRGLINAFVHESQIHELEHLLEDEEPFIANAAFGNFSDISKQGTAIITDLIGEHEYLEGLPGHDHSNCTHD